MAKFMEDAPFREIREDAEEHKRVAGKNLRWRGRALFFASFVLRFLFIAYPSSVVFDETHFVGFAIKYIKREFILDVHPPLGKLLFALVGWAGGIGEGTAVRQIQESYIGTGIPYVAMRALSCLCSALVPLIAYKTLAVAGFGETVSLAGGALVLVENSFQTLMRLVMLDSFVLTLNAASLLLFCGYWKKGSTLALLLLGLCMGLCLSVKWVGLFMFPPVLLFVSCELWGIATDHRRKIIGLRGSLVLALLVRAACLVAVPLCIYVLSFAAHFALQSEHNGNAYKMSFNYQVTLNSHPYTDSARYVESGAFISLAFKKTRQHLSSTNVGYGGDSARQCVFAAYGRNHEALWEIRRLDGGGRVRSGDSVYLISKETGRYLHSDETAAPISSAKSFKEVCTHAESGGAVWVIESGGGDVQCKNRDVRLRHRDSERYLGVGRARLKEERVAEYGYEVFSTKDGRRERTVLVIDDNSGGGAEERVQFTPLSPLGKLVELNRTMFEMNDKMTGNHPFSSAPSQWPLHRATVSLWSGATAEAEDGNKDDSAYIYLVGNAPLWRLSALAVLAFPAVAVVKIRLRAREKDFFGLFLVAAYLSNYLPYFFMDRERYLHHYLPSLFFSILLFVSVVSAWPRLLCAAAGVLALSFLLRFPLSVGGAMSYEQCVLISGGLPLPCENVNSFPGLA